jgi:hypothetical protein
MSIVSLIKRILGRDTGRDGPVWCLVANLRQMNHDGELHFRFSHGDRHFPPGAKVYCFPPARDDGYENIRIVGRHKASRRYVTMVVSAKRLTHWRAQRVNNPRIAQKMAAGWDGDSQLLVERLAAEMRRCELRRC